MATTYRLTGAWSISHDPDAGTLTVEADSCEEVLDLVPPVQPIERTDVTDARPALAVGELSRTDGGES